ncbi:MAG: ABC transporter substrate-binding protein [Proteobacteria bacterium]|nr:ABC transporter substrate-binding protein [Pseudomonadota bacterium]
MTLALAVAAFGSPAVAADPVKIGVAAPLSGAAATYGRDARDGAELAADEINAKGGILGGRKIELVFEDDKGTPQGGVAAVQKLISVNRVKAITGGTNSSVVLAESAITRGKVLHVNAAAQADAITDQGNPWLFQVNNTVSANSRSFNAYIVNTLKPKTVAYMGENTEFNKTILELLKTSLKDAGIELVNTSIYDSNTNDFTSIITKIKSLNPDVVYVADAYPARAAQLWKQVHQMGGFKKAVMSPGVVTAGMINPSEGAMEGVVTGEIYMPSLEGDANKAFVEAFKKKTGSAPGKGQLVSYEAVKVIAAGMDKAGSDSNYDKIAEAIRSTPLATPRGELKFDAKGRASAPYFFIQQVKDGQLVQIDRVKSQ